MDSYSQIVSLGVITASGVSHFLLILKCILEGLL